MRRRQTTFFLRLDGHDIEVRRKKIKYMRLTLYENGVIRLSAPEKASAQEIQSFLDSKSAWLRSNLARLEQGQRCPESFALPRDRLFLWGKEYPLALHEHADNWGINMEENQIELFIPEDSPDPAFYIERLYAQETEIKVAPLLDFWTRKMNLDAIHCQIRAMRSRWGSCTPASGRIRLNSWLASYVPQCLEYVLVHELCHFFERNHGSGFYNLLEDHLPDWKSRREILRRGNRER